MGGCRASPSLEEVPTPKYSSTNLFYAFQSVLSRYLDEEDGGIHELVGPTSSLNTDHRVSPHLEVR